MEGHLSPQDQGTPHQEEKALYAALPVVPWEGCLLPQGESTFPLSLRIRT